MDVVWNQEGVTIFSQTNSKFKDNTSELWITGYCQYKRQMSSPAEIFIWSACAMPSGWYVEIQRYSNARIGSYQGSTFNLPLEIATAVRRLA